MSKIIKQKYEIAAPMEKIWKALTDVTVITAWGGGPAVMDANTGTEFSLWGGDIHGKNIEIVPGKKLVQEWYGGDWPKPSLATFILSEPKPGITLVELIHEDVPEAEVENFDQGWKDYYLGALKDYLEK